MGIAVCYRGSLADPDRIEDFEDRVLDLALELGGQARIWRSANDDNPSRMVRGVILDLCPGQETTSLLISPEGWLIGLIEIKDAEKGQLAEPPWCFVKTQYGSVEGHVALVEMLAALKKEFMPDLEVQDEGGYWETRDAAKLAKKMADLQAAIDVFAEHLRADGLSREAAEDPEILATRIERIARIVQQTLARPAEHPPVRFGDEDEWSEDDGTGPESEAQWDASFKENRRRQERMQRTIEERLARGEDFEEAFDAAILENTAAGLPEDPDEDDAGWEVPDDWLADDADEEEDEPWKESLGEAPDDLETQLDRHERHPLQKRARDLNLKLYRLFESQPKTASSAIDTMLHGAGDITGGLAQALSSEPEELFRGLAIVQLKRALRGAAFAWGALFPLRADGTINKAVFDELRTTIEGIQAEIYAELRRLREGSDAS